MTPERDVFHCSGTGSFITAVWLCFYPSFLCDSFISASGSTLPRVHPHWWHCSGAAISSLMQKNVEVMMAFVSFSHQFLPNEGCKEISVFYICCDKGKDKLISCISCTPAHPSVAEDKWWHRLHHLPVQLLFPLGRCSSIQRTQSEPLN